MTDISIVMVNWNAGAELRACLESVRAHPPDRSYEVIVVDNASTDGSIDAARPVLPEARWILNRQNRGLAAANNQGLIASTGSVIVLSNPDVRFRPGVFTSVQSTFDIHEDVGLIVTRVLLPDGSIQTTAGDLPTLREALLGREHQRRKRGVGKPHGFCWDGWSHSEERDVGRAGDVCFAVRRTMVSEVGLIDERFPLDWEAIDWSRRAREAGWRIRFIPMAEVVHHAGTSTGKARPAQWVLDTHRGMYRFFANDSPRWIHPLLAALFGARGLVKIAWMTLRARATTLSPGA